MEHKEIVKQADADLKSSENLMVQLHGNFGDVIPFDTDILVSAANLAFMATKIIEYSELKKSLVTMMGAKTLKAGDLELTELHLNLFQLGISTALELVGAPKLSEDK